MSTVGSPPRAVQALTAALVDYAGLFPPAALDMSTAVANYAAYRHGADAAMLGRFVVPVARLGAWRDAMAALHGGQEDWRLSALLGEEAAADLAQVTAFNAEGPWGARIDVLEGRCTSPEAVTAMAALVPAGITLYCELPWQQDPTPLVAAVRAAGVRAKIRTGGVTPELIPPHDAIIRFLRACHDAGVPCKATAGLHHPLRGLHPLTYEPHSPRAAMYGYLNVFLAAAVIAAGGSDADAGAMLLLTDARALHWDGDTVTVRLPHAVLTLSAAQLSHAREAAAIAFGSCSFREPVDELATLLAASSSPAPTP